MGINRNKKVVIRDRNQKDSNQQKFDTLRIFSWNCRGFPLSKGPKLSWMPRKIDIILLVETWEHEESKVPDIDEYVLWSIWNKRSCRRGIGVQSVTLGRTYPHMLGFIRKTLVTNFFGQR